MIDLYCRQCGNALYPTKTNPAIKYCQHFDCVLAGVPQLGTSIGTAPNSLQKQCDALAERLAEVERLLALR